MEVPFLINILLFLDETKRNMNLTPKENKQKVKARLCDIRHDYMAVTVDSNITLVAQLSALTKHLNIYSFSQTDFTA